MPNRKQPKNQDQDTPYHLKHRDSLFNDIVMGLKNLAPNVRMTSVRVRFFVEDMEVKEILGLNEALDILSRDTYWDEEGNWSEATRAEVDTY